MLRLTTRDRRKASARTAIAKLSRHLVAAALSATLPCLVPTAGLADEPPGPGVLVVVLPRDKGPDIEKLLLGRLKEAGLEPHSVHSLSWNGEEATEGLRELEERARDLELEMRFREAATLWRDYRDGLLGSTRSVLSPELLAEAQLALASSWVESGELELARLEFRRALGIDSRFRAGHAYSPRVRAFFEEAADLGPSLPPAPADEVMDELMAEGGMDSFVWLSFGVDEAGWMLVRRVRMAGEAGPSTEVRRGLPGEPRAATPELLAEAERIALEIRAGMAPAGEPVRPPVWRRRWFVIGASGALTALAAGLATAHVLSPPMIEIEVRH